MKNKREKEVYDSKDENKDAEQSLLPIDSPTMKVVMKGCDIYVEDMDPNNIKTGFRE